MSIMKVNNILTAAVLVGTALSMTSCGDSFLKEELTTAKSTQSYETHEGLDELTTGAYQKLKFKFNYVWAIECYNMGIDEFTSGANNMTGWNAYSTSLNSSNTEANQPMWDNMYGLIEPANILIANLPRFYGKESVDYNTRLGEAYFLRAYGYFELVKQFGGVPLKLQPSKKVETYFTRNSTEEVYAQIISDLETAYGLLPEKVSAVGRISKSAAAHFLAKAHLFRASELYAAWNEKYKNADLDAVIKYGKEVIAAHPLCTDFVQLWDYKKANGDNEKVSEVVLAAQFSDDKATWGRYGNQMHLYYPSVYQNLAGCMRDISGDREFSYVSATEYSMQVFDRVNDSRFWKSFITTYNCNSTAGAPTWNATDAAYLAPGNTVGQKRFKSGEVGVKYVVNNPGDTRYTDQNGKKSDLGVLKDGHLCGEHTFVRYYAGEKFSWNIAQGHTTGNYYGLLPAINRSVALSKFRDGYRDSYNSQFGTRDAIIARSADDVLMVAEAYARKADYDNAITYLNMVRDRAGYANGEDRAKHVDGGQAYKNNAACSGGTAGRKGTEAPIYCETNTYYESNNIAVTTAATKAKMHLNSIDDILNSSADKPIYEALKCATTAEKVMCFIMDERTRELIGESLRWEDLARTKTLESRWKAFNCASTLGQGAFDPTKHYLRPIPQNFLDGITNAAGAALTADEKAAMQNPGY